MINRTWCFLIKLIFFLISPTHSHFCLVCKISDTSREKLLSDENNQDIQTKFQWTRKFSVAAGCKGNTVELSAARKSSVNLEKYCSLLLCAPLTSPVVGSSLTKGKSSVHI